MKLPTLCFAVNRDFGRLFTLLRVTSLKERSRTRLVGGGTLDFVNLISSPCLYYHCDLPQASNA